MGLFQVSKPKSASKIMVPPSGELEEKVLSTLRHIAQMVGATLGPGGKQVLIERPEIGMKPLVTKDGVTVCKSLGYDNAINQLILEAARDAAIRTANEAGDGTTTATILSSSIADSTNKVVRANPKFSPQRIVRELQSICTHLDERIKGYSIPADNEETLRRVAVLSANGDHQLADHIINALNTVGDEGNLTIVETSGPSKYEVARIHGYTVDRGYEESARSLSQGFINDRSGTKVVLNNPLFLLYDGVINDISQVFDVLNKLSEFNEKTGRVDLGCVIVAHGFSDIVLGDLHVNWNHPKTKIKVFPLITPESAITNSRSHFLYDLQAYTGSPVFNPIDKPISDADPEMLYKNNRVTFFEADRYKSILVAQEDLEAIDLRVGELKEQLKNPESQYEENELRVRIGKLTSGIARLIISGPSQGETREKRDRAEDAWMAIKGALRGGACPGGGYVLARLAADLIAEAATIPESTPRKFAMMILAEALLRPIEVLYQNYGYTEDEIKEQLVAILRHENETFDISEQRWVPKYELLDSVPAVSEAIRNSISIASLLGSLGGIVAFKRDLDSDKAEEKFVRDFEAATGERGSVSQE